MTFWDKLRSNNIKIATENYTFASPRFIEAFIKVASDLDCPKDKIIVSLNQLEESYLKRNNANSCTTAPECSTSSATT